MHTNRRLLALACALLAACQAPQTEAPNRDPHGQADVAHYIERLQSEGRVENLQVDLVIEKLALPDNAVVGDLGCGPGVFAIPLGRTLTAGLVYAADVEPRQLDALRANITASGVHNVIPVLASFDDPHFPPGRLDLVFIGDTLHHFEDRVNYLARLQHTLRPGGRIAVLEYKPGPLPVGPPPDHKLQPGELEREMKAAGYVLVERFDTHSYHDFVVWRVGQEWER